MSEKFLAGVLPILALRGLTVFPEQTVHFDIGRAKSIKALEVAMKGDQTLFLVPQKDIVVDDPGLADLYTIGTVVKVKQVLKNQGDTLRVLVSGICRAKITEVELSERKADSKPFEYITECPECGATLVRYEGEAKHYCPNQGGCRPQILGRIVHFIRRKALDIDGLGTETVELLHESGLLNNIADIYDLKAVDLAALPRLGEKSADNIIRSINSSKSVPFARVLFGLGIRFVGETTAKYLAAHFKTLDAVMTASKEQLLEAEEVGDKIADAILEYFADEKNIAIIERLRAAGLQFEEEAKVLHSNCLEGKNVVISGKFLDHSRDELKELIELHGGKNQSGVSANTDFIVAGENMGPAKLQKAEKLGVKILSESDFIALIGGEKQNNIAVTNVIEKEEKKQENIVIQGSLF